MVTIVEPNGYTIVGQFVCTTVAQIVYTIVVTHGCTIVVQIVFTTDAQIIDTIGVPINYNRRTNYLHNCCTNCLSV